MENLFPTILIALSLAMDSATVAMGSGACDRKFSLQKAFFIAVAFGFFQWMMTAIGGLLGNFVPENFLLLGNILAGILVMGIGGKMLWEAFSHEGEKCEKFSFFWLLGAAFATSIDALGVGISFALLQESFWIPSLLIGVVAFSLSFFAYIFGKKLQKYIGEKGEIFGGIVLLIIGGKILFWS